MENAQAEFEAAPSTWTAEVEDFQTAQEVIELPPDESEELSPLHVFKAWMEDWEKEIYRKNDPQNETKLASKYQGQHLWDEPKLGANYRSVLTRWSRFLVKRIEVSMCAYCRG